MRAFSYGGGVQSTAALVLASQSRIDYSVFLFSNVGDDSENPATLDYVHNVAMPFATDNNISLYEISKPGETLYQRTVRHERSIKIPVRMKNGAPGRRDCTTAYKRNVIRKWLGKGDHVVGLGISIDEFERMRTDSGFSNIMNEYPLIDMRISRADCIKIINDAGLPIPPKSSCYFCPFHDMNTWRTMRREQPELFTKSVELEQLLNKKRRALGRDEIYLTSTGQTLDMAVGLQWSLFDSPCESGHCFT